MFCIVYSYRMVGYDLYPLHGLIPWIPWVVSIKMEYISLYLSVLFFGEFTLRLYPRESSFTFMRILSAISIGLVALTITLPPYYFTQFVTPFFLLLTLYILYTFYVYVRTY